MFKRIKKGLSRLRDAALNVLARHILVSMTDNLNFTTPVPTLPDLEDAVDAYSEALSDAKDRDKQKVLIKNQRKTELKAMLAILFDYVNLTGGTDIEVLASSGFPLAKVSTPVGDMPKPFNVKITLGDGSGEAHLGFKKISGADSYIYNYKLSDADDWITIYETSRRITLTGLTPGKEYVFRVSAVGAKGQGPWSDEIYRFIS